MFNSIKTKIVVLQIFLLVAVMAIIGGGTYGIAYNLIISEQKHKLQVIVQDIKEDVKRKIEREIQDIKHIAGSKTIRQYINNKTANINNLKEYICYNQNYYDVIAYIDQSGFEITKAISGKTTNSLGNVAAQKYFKKVVKDQNSVAIEYVPFSSEVKGSAICLAAAVKDSQNVLQAVIMATTDTNKFISQIAPNELAEEAYNLIADADGMIFYCTDKEKIGKKIDRQIFKNNFSRMNIFAKDSYSACAAIENQNWFAVSVMPKKIFTAELDMLRNTLLGVVFIVFAVAIMLSMLVAGNITKPVQGLSSVAEAITKGFFTQKIQVQSNDEIGQLAKAFNRMLEYLENTTTSIVNLNKEVKERGKVEKSLQKLNEQMTDTVEKLTAANADLSDFAHVTAHDLRAPLRAIGSLAGILKNEDYDRLSEKGRTYLDTIQQRIERMSHLITGILRYSELAKNISPKPVPIGQVIDEAVEKVKIPANIDFSVRGNFPVLGCDRTQMIMVFSSLLENAVKFMQKARGYITVGCQENNDEYKFFVADSGRGINSKYFNKIFKIFQTIDRRDEFESSGIGLAVAKKIIQFYDGKIWVESKENIGSTFYFTLPKKTTEIKNEQLQTDTVS